MLLVAHTARDSSLRCAVEMRRNQSRLSVLSQSTLRMHILKGCVLSSEGNLL